MRPIHRPEDDELCGFVVERADGWHALTVFGGELGICSTSAAADDLVRTDGLSSLMERWILVDGESPGEEPDEQVVCIQEANPHSVTLALDYYSMPGVPKTSSVSWNSGGWWKRPTPPLRVVRRRSGSALVEPGTRS